MKNLDLLSKRIISISLSFTVVVLSLTLFMATVSPASAGSNAVAEELKTIEEFAAMPAVGNGKIMMDYTSVYVPTQDKTYYEVMVWNTETGESKLYFYDSSTQKFKAYGPNVQLPSNPLD